MKKFQIEDVKVGVSKSGLACGPVSGSVVAEVCVRDTEEGTVKYHSLAEVDGTVNFFETDISTYDRQIANDPDDEEFWNMLNEHNTEGFTDYYEFFDSLEEKGLYDEARQLIQKYLVYLVRAEWEEVDQMKAASIGKCFGEFEIPVCDVEQEYLDENEDEESEEDDSESLEELLEMIREEFVGQCIDTNAFDFKEEDSPEGMYSSYVKFQDNGKEYQLKYGLWINENAEITHVEKPDCERLEGEEYVKCPEGEVSAQKICKILRDELNSWL